MSIRKGTTIIAGNSSPLDWTGTLEEYNIALENGTIKPNMVCYVTDDTLYTDDIRPEIDRLDNVKANKDLSNLSEVGEKHFLNKSQITNCITEIPQRIKYTLVDGTLTLLKGSVVIVPYGLEDKTEEFPVGSVFINDNFKVYDTQFADGKFFVWVELPNDMSFSRVTTDSNQRFIVIYLDKNTLEGAVVSATTSGSTLPTTGLFYNTTDNTIKYYSNSSVVNAVTCLPFGLCTANGANIFGTIDQVFNGIGYIGSTIWVDKGVKAIAPNGRNADGTLNNYEFTTSSIIAHTRTDALNGRFGLFLNPISFVPSNTNYDEESNYNIVASSGVVTVRTLCGYATYSSGVVTEFKIKTTYRALDYNDKAKIGSWSAPSDNYISITLGATGSTYTAPANGWFSLGGLDTIGAVSNYGFVMRRTKDRFGVCGRIYSTAMTTGWCVGTLRVRKGDVIGIYHNIDASDTQFRFYYAEGEV